MSKPASVICIVLVPLVLFLVLEVRAQLSCAQAARRGAIKAQNAAIQAELMAEKASRSLQAERAISQ